MPRAYTINTNVTANDRASKNLNRITGAADRMAKTFTRTSGRAGRSYDRFINSVSRNSKRGLVNIKLFESGARKSLKSFSDRLVNFKNLAIIGTIGLVLSNVVGTFANFEQANVNLASVMGKTVSETVLLQDDAKRLGATTAKTATEVIGLQESLARLGFEEQPIINMTESIISGSIAMQGELAKTAELTGAMVKTFDQFGSIDTPKIIDQMTLATQKSALNFQKLETGLPIVSGAANAAGVPFTKLLALMGKLSDAGIDTSSSATALRNIFIDSKDAGESYEQILERIKGSQDKLTAANDKFGKRGAVSAAILSNNIDQIAELDKVLQLDFKGTAALTASRQLDTLQGSVTILGSAWEGFILSLDDGTGSFSNILKWTVQVATEILSLATGTEKATSELNDNQKTIRTVANTMLFLLNTLKWAAAAYLTFKTAMFLVKVGMLAYNVVGGITIALTNGQTLATNAAKAAQIAYAVTMKVITAAQWLYSAALAPAVAATWAFTTALLANPIVWIVIGIAALIAAIVLLVVYWDEVTIAVGNFYNKIKENPITKFLFAPIIAVIEAIKLLIEAGKKVYEFFGGEMEVKQTNKEIKETNKAVKVTGENIDVIKFDDYLKAPVINATSKEDKIVAATNKNTDAIDKNTGASKKEWKGKFTTSILRDANIPNSAIKTAQREIAVSGLAREFKNTSIQNSIISNNNIQSGPNDIVTPFSSTKAKNENQSTKGSSGRNNNSSQQVNITINDKTGDNFNVEVESTGIEVNTTGN